MILLNGLIPAVKCRVCIELLDKSILMDAWRRV